MFKPGTRHLLDLLGIQLPIVQAPMAGVSSPTMAAAASSAGGLGSIAVGAVNAVEARRMLVEVRTQSDQPFNVNVFCHRPAVKNAAVENAWIERFRPQFAAVGVNPPSALTEIYRSFVEDDAMLQMLLSERPKVVSFHFGLPSDAAVRALRAAGIVLMASATNLGEARAAARAGVDVVVAQGWEAGGHRGVFDPQAADDKLGTMALTRLLVQHTHLPIIAAGGIMDGAGIAAALALGAGAAQLGTAFIACDESQADDGFRKALASDASNHTTMASAISGRPARSLATAFTGLATGIPLDEIPVYPIAYDLGKALHTGAKKVGNYGYGAYWAGQGAPLARSVPTALLIDLLAAELTQAL
jgi:nitronate monooxygenase